MQPFRSFSCQQLRQTSNARSAFSTRQQIQFSTFRSLRVVPLSLLPQLSPREGRPKSTLATPLQQRRNSSFLHDNSVPSSSRQSQKTARESNSARRRRERNARSKISTLALDRNTISFETAPEVAKEAQGSRQVSQQEQKNNGSGTSQSMSPRSRRLLLLAGVLLFPVIGRDLIEAVVPGLLGVLIFIGGNVKAAVRWIRSLGTEERR